MKKRFMAVLLSALMVVSLLPVTAFADETENIGNEITMEVTESMGEVQEVATMSAPSADSAEVLADWNSSYLNELETKVYNDLAAKIVETVHNGGEMILTISLNGVSIDNGGETDNDKRLELAKKYIEENIRTTRIYNALICNYPYEMFWYDLMDRSFGSMGYSISTVGNTTYITSITYYMPVYSDYQDKNSENPKNTLSSSAASKGAKAAANAQEIVNANAGKSDMEKLEVYKDAICDLASYDLEAREIIGNPDHPLFDTFYGDPFQITSVFDRDPETESTSEAYAKAFKYLCDLSDFDSTECYYVTGNLIGNGTSGFVPGGEQNWLNFSWNIVKTEGKSYLVDVINSDTGTFGEPDYVFMKEPARGNMNDGYWFNGAKDSEINYIYSSVFTTDGLYDATILDLNGRYMTGSISLSGTPTIGETLTVEVKGAPTFSTIQWYRDDTPIPGANGNTYTLSSGEDVGKIIKVVVSASGCEGTLTAQTSEAVKKANPEPVNDINILSVTDTSITIQTYPGEVYACVDVSDSVSYPTEEQWGTSGEFTGLSAGKAYAVFARRNETDTHYGTTTTGYKFEVVTTSTRIIMRVEVTIDQPVKYQDLPAEATVHTSNMTATLVWYEGQDTTGEPVTGKAKPNQYYTAKVTLQADDGYEFGKGCYVKVNDATAEFPLEGQSVMSMNIIFQSPTAPVELTNIEVTKQPDKTDYIDGEKFDPTGMTVTAYYDDGTNNTVDLSECTFTPETLTGGINEVTVSYGGKTASVPVTVTVPRELTGIEVTKQPDKTEYKENESFDQTGMEVKAKYSDGSSETVSLDECTFSPEILTEGVTFVTVTYKEKTASVPVTVIEAELTGIEITKQPDKTEYFDGDSFDPTGMEITAAYENGSTKPVSIENCTFSPETLTEGVTFVTVTYNGKTASVPVTVKAVELAGIEVTKQPDKTEYFDGDSFDPTGIEITAVYNNGSRETVSAEDCTFSPETLTEGLTSVTVTYNGKTALVYITVNSENSAPKSVCVGNTDITSGGYWTSVDGITWTKYDGIPEDNYVYYNPDYNTLTLHNATIHGEDCGIYVCGFPHKSVDMTIILEGENIISNTGGIRITTDSYKDTLGKDVTLTINGPGSLKVDSWQHGININGDSGKATLNINNASVEANGKDFLGRGISLYAGVYAEFSELIININESSVTARSDFGNYRSGIYYNGTSSNDNIAKLNISNNSAITIIGGIKTVNTAPPIPEVDDNSVLNCIVFNGNDRIVYGDVELQMDFTIKSGESMTIPEGASLSTGSYAVIVKTGGILNGVVNGTVKYAPTITTESLVNGDVLTSYEQQLNADGDPTITWSITEGSLPEGLSLDENTGIISGKPSAGGKYTFTVTATNSIDSYSKEFSIEINDYVLGDVNMDGNLDITDATTIQRYVVSIPIEGTFNKELADVNQDGKITINDVTAIQIILTKK